MIFSSAHWQHWSRQPLSRVFENSLFCVGTKTYHDGAIDLSNVGSSCGHVQLTALCGCFDAQAVRARRARREQSGGRVRAPQQGIHIMTPPKFGCWAVRSILPPSSGLRGCRDRGVAQLSNNLQATAPAFGPPSRHWKSSNRLGGPSQIAYWASGRTGRRGAAGWGFGGRQHSGLQLWNCLFCLGGPPMECCLTARQPCELMLLAPHGAT